MQPPANPQSPFTSFFYEQENQSMSWSYVLKRLGFAGVSLFGVLVVTFLISHVVPGDPAVIAAGRIADPKVVDHIRKEMGLDKPVYQQFLIYLERLIVKRDMGRSLISRRPVVEDLKAYFPATFELVTITLILVTIIGIFTGVASANRKNSAVDHTIRAITLSGISMPEFWLAIVLQLLLVYVFAGFPIDGRISIEIIMGHPMKTITGLYTVDSLLQLNWPVFKSALAHLALPVFTLTFCYVPQVTRIARAAMIEVMYQDYIKTAEAAGLSSFKVIYKYGLRNALIPVSTIIGMVYGFLLGGTVLTELIFSWPGIGRYVVQAIFRLDFPAIMGVTILSAAIVIALNFVVDMLIVAINPTVRYT
jgi:peptide/nickel transport system permease protein